MLRRIRSLSACLFLILGSSLSAQEGVAPPDEDFYKTGLEALRDELPELAATRFEKALEARKEDDPLRTEIQLRLIEALVRADHLEKRADPLVRSGHLEKALPLLDLPSLSANQTAQFWKARILISLGHFYDAATALEQLSDAKDPTLRRTAALTRARLLASLGESRSALPLLESLSEDEDPGTAVEAKLLRASFLLGTGDLESAHDLLEDTATETPSHQKQKQYLKARLALEKEDWAEADALFRGLADDPRNLPQQLHLGAILGLADALDGLGHRDAAVAHLLAFLEKHPDTGYLDPFFIRLIPWVGESETLKELLQARLLVWSSPSVPKGDPILRSLDDPVATALTNALDDTPSNLYTFSLYHRALHLAHKNDSESVSAARFLLARLRLENPHHPLALASLLETGLLHLGDKHPAEALGAIEALEELASPGPLKAEAAELAARIRFAEIDFAEAGKAFARARKNFRGDNREVTATNQGLSLLLSGQSTEFSELLASLENQDAILDLKLERALLGAANKDENAKDRLDSFLRSHPGHLRTAEARLAVAELSLTQEPHDLSMALAQLDSIDPALHPDKIALRHLLARLRLGELTGEWEDATAAATAYLRTRGTPESGPLMEDAVLMKLGEAYYLNGDFNHARIQFMEVADRKSAAAYREVALFLAAKSALQINDNARADGLKILHEVSAKNGPLAEEARLQLGRTYIDVAEPEKALTELSPLIAPGAESPSRTKALLLAAEAQKVLGGPSHLAKSLEVYNALLADPDLPYALNNRIHYEKGEALEKLRQPGEALETYYQVISQENLPDGEPISEWVWFYKCGFRALHLLEASKRWRSAYRIAILLEKAGGPLSDKAAKRASDLQLDHQIWE